MRNLKKSFALVLVVAMMVTMLVPAFGASTFNYEAEANTLFELGLYRGESDDEFVPNLGGDLNRETGVVMLLRLFGQERTAEEAMTREEAYAALEGVFTDSEEISDWAVRQVAYAVENGFVVGIEEADGTFTFRPKADLNGLAYATLILTQLGHDFDYAEAPVTLYENGGLSMNQAIRYLSNAPILRDDLVGMSYGSLRARDTEGKTVIEKLVEIEYVPAEKAVEAGFITEEPGEEPQEPSEDLEVVSVSANNLKTVTVTFDQLVEDEVAAERVANYEVKRGTSTVSVADVVLSEEKESVTLVFTNTLTADQEYSLKISNVANFEDTFTPSDSSVPTILGVESLGQQSFVVTFSEPVRNVGAVDSNNYQFKLNDDQIKDNAPLQMTNAPEGSRDLTKWTFILDNPIPAGEHTLQLVRNGATNVEDYAGYKVPISSRVFTVIEDTTVPTVESVTALSQTEIEVNFNKPVNVDNSASGLNGDASGVFAWRANTTSVAQSADTTNAITKVNLTTIRVKFTANPLPADETVQVVFTTSADIKDFSGFQLANKVISDVHVAGDELPNVLSVTSENDGEFVIEYNKAMEVGTGTNGVQRTANYTLEKDGEEVSLAGTTIAAPTSENKVRVSKASWALEAGTYQLTVSNVKDAVGNIMEAKIVTFEVEDTTPPQTVTLTAAYEDGSSSTDEDIFIITFDEAVATSGDFSVLTPSKYEISVNDGSSYTTLDADKVNVIEMIDEKTVRIRVEGDAYAINTSAPENKVRVTLIADAHGNVIPERLTSAGVQGVDTSGAEYDLEDDATAVVKAEDTIELKVTRQIDTFVAGEFDVRVNSVSIDLASVSYENTDTGATITIVVDDVEELDLTETITVGIKDITINTEDINGFAFEANKYVTATIEIQPVLNKVVRTSATTLDLVLSQDIALTDDNDFIVELGNEVFTIASTSASNNVVTITLATPLASASEVPTVRTLSDVDDITTQTATGAKLVPVTERMTAVNFRASAIQFVNNGDANKAGTDEIRITFNRAIDPGKLITDDNLADSGGSAWDGTDLAVAVGGIAIMSELGSGNDAIVLKNNTEFGAIDLGATNVVSSDADSTVTATIKLSDDKRVVTIVFGGNADDLGFEDNFTVLGNISGARYVPHTDIEDEDGNMINVSGQPVTATKF